MVEPEIAIVVAVAENGVIGREGALPWRLSTDLKRFKALTLGAPVVMGRKTFESIGRPLPGRANIVISRDPAYPAPSGVEVVASLEAGLEAARAKARAGGLPTVFVIGGAEIYRQALARADALHITHVEASIEGDAHFDPVEPARFVLVSEERIPPGPADSHATRYAVYRRR